MTNKADYADDIGWKDFSPTIQKEMYPYLGCYCLPIECATLLGNPSENRPVFIQAPSYFM